MELVEDQKARLQALQKRIDLIAGAGQAAPASGLWRALFVDGRAEDLDGDGILDVAAGSKSIQVLDFERLRRASMGVG